MTNYSVPSIIEFIHPKLPILVPNASSYYSISELVFFFYQVLDDKISLKGSHAQKLKK